MGAKAYGFMNKVSLSLIAFLMPSLFLFHYPTNAFAIDFVTDIESITVPEGDKATFKVKLSQKPLFRITVSVRRVSGDGDITVESGATLTFTKKNWKSFKKVVLEADEDDDTINGSATIRISSLFVNDKDLTATESDDDALTFVTDTDAVKVTEGGTTTFQVKLDKQPPADVHATVTRTGGDSDITVQSGSALTFTPANWDTFQRVTLAAAEDPDTVDGTATMGVNAPDIPAKEVTAAEDDNDTLTFVTDNESVTVPEGGTATFRVMLGAQPQADVSASISRTSGDSDITVQSGSTLTFTTSSWDTFQPVTLAAEEDPDGVNSAATIRISDTAGFIPEKDVTATEGDDENITVVSPNGGEVWPLGSSRLISWTGSIGIAQSVQIELYTGGSFLRTIVPSTQNTGSYTWDISPDLDGGSTFRVRVAATGDISIDDLSDDDFTLLDPDEDSDGDGVPDVEEMGPAGDDPEYDGNQNGLPDIQEDSVASLHTFDESHYVTLEGPRGIKNIQAFATPPDLPGEVAFPYGFFKFEISGLTTSNPAATVILYLDGQNPDTYWKFGPTFDDFTPHWYPFLYDGETGAEFDGFRVTLHLVDGEMGDDDLVANGTIIDQGGPGITGGSTTPETGKDCFIATAAYDSEGAPSVRVLRRFRDTFLLTNTPGRWFVTEYYRHSPPMARWLAKHPAARAFLRLLLTPLIVLAWTLLTPGLVIPATAAICLFALAIAAVMTAPHLLNRLER